MPALRYFKSFGNTAPVVPFAFPVSLVDMNGYAAGAGWLQIHDSATVVGGAEVPIASFYVAGAGPLPSIFQTLGPLTLLKGLCIAFSSTEATYTALATSYDIFGDVDEYEGIDPYLITGASTVGDRTTGVNSLQVWSEATGLSDNPYLISVYATNSALVAQYLMLFSTDAAADGSIPLVTLTIPASSSRTLNFGPNGLRPKRESSAYVITKGCSLFGSSTAGTLTAVADNSFKIEAVYKS